MLVAQQRSAAERDTVTVPNPGRVTRVQSVWKQKNLSSTSSSGPLSRATSLPTLPGEASDPLTPNRDGISRSKPHTVRGSLFLGTSHPPEMELGWSEVTALSTGSRQARSSMRPPRRVPTPAPPPHSSGSGYPVGVGDQSTGSLGQGRGSQLAAAGAWGWGRRW